jgi:hypothetical protein
MKEFFMKPFIRSLAKKILPIIVQKEKYTMYADYWYDAYIIAKKAYIKDHD